MTVESDRKQIITRTSPVPPPAPPPPPPPPIVAPKPYGKIITEYRTVRRIGNSGEPTLKRNDITSSTDSDKRSSTNSISSHEELMESIRRFGGLQSLGKK